MSGPRQRLAIVSTPTPPWSVAHESHTRLRLRIATLKRRPERCTEVERRLRALPGVQAVRSTPRLGTLTIRYSPAVLERRRLERHLLDLLLDLPVLRDATAMTDPSAGRVDPGQLALLALGLVATPLLPLSARYAVTVAAIAPSVWKALAELRKPGAAGGVQDAAALALATLAGRYGTAQVNNFLHHLGLYFEQEAVERVESALRAQVQSPSGSFVVQRAEQEFRCEVQALLAGDRLSLGVGTCVPLQAMVVAGDGEVVAGGSARRGAHAGNLLAAGTRIETGFVDVVLLQNWSDGTYRRLQSFVEMIIREREGAERDASGVSDRLAAYTLLVSGAVFGFTRSLRRTSSTLQADFGTALGLVIPVAVEAAIASAAAGGVLFRSGAALAKLAKVDCLVFDKTGTLSEGQWHLESVIPAEGVADARAEQLFSEVVLACLRPQVAHACDPADPPVLTTLTHREVQELGAQGLQLHRDRRKLAVMTVAQAQDRLGVQGAGDIPAVHGSRLRLCLMEDGTAVAEFVFANPPAEGADQLIDELRAAGIGEIHMITTESDHEIPAELRALELNGCHTGLDELDKQQFILDLEARGRSVALISDGLFQARGECLSVCLAASPEYRQLDADVWLLWPDLASIVAAQKTARTTVRLLESNQRGNLIGNGAVLLAASFDLISSTTAAAVSNAITLGLLQRAREQDGGPLP